MSLTLLAPRLQQPGFLTGVRPSVVTRLWQCRRALDHVLNGRCRLEFEQ
jgi:hypothetical protein